MDSFWRRIYRGFALTTTLSFTAIAAVSAAPLRPVEGPVILARAGATPMYLWNATLYVSHLVTDKALGDTGLRALEATAADALASKAASSTARSVSIQVVYARTGAVSPVYNTATFTGMEKVVTITAPREVLVRNSSAWSAALANGKVPPGLRIDVTGKLPPG